MSSVQVDRQSKLAQQNKKENEKARKIFNPSHKKHKHEDNRHFKFGRKRVQSFTGNGKFFPPYKRRKKEGAIIPPTKFLLGGNICDPLNLNSMQDEEVNRAMNAVTPKSSPLPTPKHKKEVIEVIIPPNICDPLNLSNCNDNEEYEKQLISPMKKGSKRRNRKRKRASSSCTKDDSPEANEVGQTVAADVAVVAEKGPPESEQAEPQCAPPASPSHPQPKETKPESPQKDKNKLRLKGLEEPKDKRLRKVDVKDKIVSPVIPQPGAWKPRPQHRPSQDKKKKQQQLPNFREKDARYQYGNYNRYYGYRNPHQEVDPRLTVFAQRKELFFAKDILDIGCNIGHITLSVARDCGARSVTGIDIDRTLINIARKNIKHYVNCVQSPASNDDGAGNRKDADASFFPMSMPINYGPVDIPGFTKNKTHRGFPYNVTFVQGNYVLEDDALLGSEQPQFDTILCLSISKWIHLNFGDAGLKQAFKRMHAQLRAGGVLVLEPQGWGSYNKKKNLTERIYKNYQSIQFRPNKFTQYLLSPEVGFCKCEVVSIPSHPAKGFQRPIQLFTKAGPSADQGTPVHTRNERKDQQQRDIERREYERELFPKDENKHGNMSEISQQSSESMSQYDQLENVYAPSATPCYDDTLGDNNDSQPLDESKMCYLDVGIDHDKADGDAAPKAENVEKLEKLEKLEKIEKAVESDKIEKIEKSDKVEKVEKNDEVEKVKKRDKLEKIEKSDKVEKIEKSDKVEKVEKGNKVEKVEKIDKVEKIEKSDKLEKIEKSDKVEKVEKSDKVEKVEKSDKVVKVEKIDKVEKVEKIDKVEKVEKSDKVEKIEKTDKIGEVDKDDKVDEVEKNDKIEKVAGENGASMKRKLDVLSDEARNSVKRSRERSKSRADRDDAPSVASTSEGSSKPERCQGQDNAVSTSSRDSREADNAQTIRGELGSDNT